MKKRQFKEILKVQTPSEILSKHMEYKIFLTEKQLDKVINLKKGTSSEGRGAAVFIYGKTNEKAS